MLLVSSLIIVSTMPVITKKKFNRNINISGPPGGWVCLKANMPCTFQPPVRAKAFIFYFNDHTIPAFSTNRMDPITIRQKVTGGPCNGKPELVEYMDDYKKGNLHITGTYCTAADLVRIIF